jgi:murein DD-endopeptidase MepM/ murein hydrolase activator NlpD
MEWLIAVVLAFASALGTAPGTYGWPLDPVQVTRRFDPPPEPWLPGHRGVDLAGHEGDEVKAAAGGVVAFAGSVAGRGVVSILHPDGLKTTYEPVDPMVHEGTQIGRGSAIGVLEGGHAGCPVEACLHWGAKRGETYLDPLSLIGLGPIRLKPLRPEAGAARPPAAPHRTRRHRPGRRSAADRRSR